MCASGAADRDRISGCWAGVAAGRFSSVAEAAALVAVRETIDLEPAWEDAYVAAYQRFRELYPALHQRAARAAVTA